MHDCHSHGSTLFEVKFLDNNDVKLIMSVTNYFSCTEHVILVVRSIVSSSNEVAREEKEVTEGTTYVSSLKAAEKL